MSNVTTNPIQVTGYQVNGAHINVWYQMAGEQCPPAKLETYEFWAWLMLQREVMAELHPLNKSLIGYLQEAPSKEYVFSHIAGYMCSMLEQKAVSDYERDLAQIAWQQGQRDPEGYLPEQATLYLRNYSHHSSRL